MAKTPTLIVFEHKVNSMKDKDVGLADILLSRNNKCEKVRGNKTNVDLLIGHIKNFSREILDNAEHLQEEYTQDLDWDMLKIYNMNALFIRYINMVDGIGSEVGEMLQSLKDKDSVFVLTRTKDLHQFVTGFNKEFARMLKNIKFTAYVPDNRIEYIR